MKIHNFARIFASSVLLEIIISPLRGYVSFMACMVVGFILFSFLSYCVQKKYHLQISVWKLLVIVILGIVLINIDRFFDFKGSLGSLPDELFHLLGVFVGFAIYKIRSYIKWFIVLTTSILCGYMYFIGYGLWLNKLNYGTFSGEIMHEKISPTINFIDSTGVLIKINNYLGKVVILDFWNSKCGVCYQKFPEVQKTFNKYKLNSRVRFYSVNAFLNGIDKDGDAFRIIKERGYSFPVLVCKDHALLKELRVAVYPTVLILNQKGEYVFRGSIEDVDKMIQKLLKENY